MLQYIKILESTIVPSPTYFDFMQFDQNILEYHLKQVLTF